MFARFPHLTDSQGTPDEERRHRLEWHALLARLDAERELRASLENGTDDHGVATLMAEGSFDPRAAEVLFSLAASVRVAGDMPERRFAPEDLDHMSQAVAKGQTNGAARLPNAKSYDCNETQQAGATDIEGDDGQDYAVPAARPEDENVSRT